MKEKMVRVNFWMHKPIVKLLEKRAEKMGVSVAHLVRAAVRQYLTSPANMEPK